MAAIALLHAFPLDARMWKRQRVALTEAGHDVFAPDLLAAGAQANYSAPTMDAMAEWVVGQMAARGHKSFGVAGISMGGYVAMAMLRVAPRRVAGVALFNTKAVADTDAAARTREEFAERVDREGVRWVPTAMIDVLLGETTRESRLAVASKVTRWIDEGDPTMVAWAQRAMAVRPDSTAALAVYRRPAVVVAGDEDMLSSMPQATGMAAALGGAPVSVVGKCGHLSIVERPSRTAEILTSWAARV
jgi:pimeloyl-ACP methyl ester carboxylesterase